MTRKPPPITGKRVVADPLLPTETSHAEMHAIKSLVVGKANDAQQRLFVEWLMRATGARETEFVPGDDGARLSAFASGKRFVGLQFFTLAQAILPERNAAP